LENTDQNPDSGDDGDEGEDEDKGIEGRGQEIEDTEWNRGNGWQRGADDARTDDEDDIYA
jgi:hypothetical protein